MVARSPSLGPAQQRPTTDGQGGLFEHLTLDGGGDRFARLEPAPGDRPASGPGGLALWTNKRAPSTTATASTATTGTGAVGDGGALTGGCGAW